MTCCKRRKHSYISQIIFVHMTNWDKHSWNKFQATVHLWNVRVKPGHLWYINYNQTLLFSSPTSPIPVLRIGTSLCCYHFPLMFIQEHIGDVEKPFGQHQWSHAQHHVWISTWCIFHKFNKIRPDWRYPATLVNQNMILIKLSHWRSHIALIMRLMST